MFFYPEKMDAVDTECVRQAACEHEGRNTHFINMQEPAKPGKQLVLEYSSSLDFKLQTLHLLD